MKNARDIIARGMAANAAAGGGGGGGSDPATLPVVFSIEWDSQSDGKYGTATADQTISQIYQAQIDGLVVVGVYGYGSDSAMTSVSLDLVESTTEDEAASSVTFRGISSEHVTLEITGTVNNGADAWVATSYANVPELPTPTASDFGAGLCVVKTPVEGDVIVPEQTAEYDEEIGAYVLTNTNVALFTEGATAILTVGEHSGVTVVYTDGVLVADIAIGDGKYVGFYAEDDSLFAFNEESTDPVTVKCSLASYSYEWGIDPYAGYDVVIGTANNYPETASNYTKIKWDFDALKAKTLAGEPITGILVRHYNYDEQMDGDTDIELTPLVGFYNYHDGGLALFTMFMPATYSNPNLDVSFRRITIGFDEEGDFISVSVISGSKLIG